MTIDGDAAAPPRRRRWRRVFLIATAVLLSLALFGGWLLQPEQLVPLILDRTGKALSLEITADPGATARLRGRPQLVVRNLVVRAPGAKTAMLRADRLLISLPWSSVRSGGDDPTIERLEFDAPVLDVPALQAWLAQRPPGEPPKIPTLTEGLRVVDGRIDNGDWRIESVAVDLPALHPERPAHARIRGRYLDAPTSIAFDLVLAMTKPANDAGVAVVGPLTIERGDSRIPAALTLSGPLHLGDGGITMSPAKFGVSARYVSGDTTLPFALRYTGQADLSDIAGLSLRRDATAFDGRFRLYAVLGWIDQTGGAPLPPLDGTLRSPKLEISGATLEGVRIELDDEGIAETKEETP